MYAIECLRAALDAGAENLTMCDTNGASLPHEIAAAVHVVRRALPDAVPRASTPTTTPSARSRTRSPAIAEGCRMVQGTMNGYGERCGNANLISIIPNLQLKMGYECLPSLEGLTEASHLVAEMLNLSPDANQAYVGKNAFAHKGGMHVAGVNADPSTFEHIDPSAVGNAREVLVSELSGKGTVIAHAGGALDDAVAARVVEKVKELEHRGFQFEAADGSFELLIRRETGEYQPLFKLESWRVIAEKRADGRVETEATVKVWVGSQRFVRTAEGNGPVHALDRALRAAIGERLPHLRDIKLVNFKVRILDEWKATGATTRVLLDASDGTSTLGRDRRARERHRGVLGRAGGLAGGGHAAVAGLRRQVIPVARPVIGELEEAGRARGAALAAPLARPARAGVRERVRGARGRAVRVARCRRAPPRCTSRCGRWGSQEGDEVVTSPFSFVASANSILFERATAGVRGHRPA